MKVTLVPVFRFSEQEAIEHLGLHHPHCPKDIRDAVVLNVCNRVWKGRSSLGFAIGVSLQAVLRHRDKRYRRDLRNKPENYEAIKAKYNKKAEKLIRSWSNQQAPSDVQRPSGLLNCPSSTPR